MKTRSRTPHSNSRKDEAYIHPATSSDFGRSRPRTLPEKIIALHPMIGNQAVCRLIQGQSVGKLQTKDTGEAASGHSPLLGSETDQGVSWSDIHDPKGHIASILFPTDNSELDDHDKQVLRDLFQHIQIHIMANRLHLSFQGYADFRGTEGYNVNLSRQRAQSVAGYFSILERSASNYSSEILALGETGPQTGRASEALQRYRRVDIIAAPPIKRPEPIPGPEPEPQPAAQPVLRSNRWKCRIVGSAGGGVVYGGSVFGLEIVDLNNNQRMYYQYFGGAATLGPGVSAGLSGASPGTEWQEFETSLPIRIQDFEGPARHTSGGIQLKRGPSVEVIHLLGPMIVKADSVYLEWVGAWEEGWSLGAGTDIGPLTPIDEAHPVPEGYE